MDMIRMTLSQGAFDLIEEEKILSNILHYDLYRMEREGSEGGKGRESRGRPGGNRVKGKKIGGGLGRKSPLMTGQLKYRVKIQSAFDIL